MKTTVFLLALAACGGWTAKDAILEAAYITVASADEAQTQLNTYHCDEGNPVIGECNQGRVGPYFFLTDVAHLAISLILPPEARTVWQSLTTGAEISTVYKNHLDGVPFWP